MGNTSPTTAANPRKPIDKALPQSLTASAPSQPESAFPHCLHGGAARERDSKSKIVFLQATAEGGDRIAVVLEFESFSRIIASMQSMRRCRHKRRPDWPASANLTSASALFSPCGKRCHAEHDTDECFAFALG
jgi:hypothetical protein